MEIILLSLWIHQTKHRYYLAWNISVVFFDSFYAHDVVGQITEVHHQQIQNPGGLEEKQVEDKSIDY